MAGKITIVDIQHKTFKKKLQGYDPTDVDQFLDEVIETLADSGGCAECGVCPEHIRCHCDLSDSREWAPVLIQGCRIANYKYLRIGA